MIIEAETFTYRGIWKSDTAYAFAENDPLIVHFSEKHAGDTVSIRGVASVRTFRLDENGAVEIPIEMIKTGPLTMHVERYDGGKLVRTWTIDPLTLTRNEDGVISAAPWVVSIEERICSLENAIFGQSSPIFE